MILLWCTGAAETEAFEWLPEDVAELATFQVILAADMIYDDDLTEAFVRCMASFLESDAGRPGEDPGSTGRLPIFEW